MNTTYESIVMKSKLTLSTIAVLLTLAACTVSAGDKSLDIKTLDGNWKGVGQFLVPVTNFNVDINGKASFQWIPEGNYLRTSLTGDKLFFTYSDSGHLVHNPATDSISWEVWDNTGKHAKYLGKAEGNEVHGARMYGKDLYEVMIKLVTPDSIDFKLKVTQPDGDSFNKATFNLWRVKE